MESLSTLQEPLSPEAFAQLCSLRANPTRLLSKLRQGRVECIHYLKTLGVDRLGVRQGIANALQKADRGGKSLGPTTLWALLWSAPARALADRFSP